MLFLHVKTGHVYEFKGLVITEATLEPAVMYYAPGFEDMPFTRPAKEFFDGRFKLFVPNDSFTEGYFDSNGRAQFGDTPADTSGFTDDDEDHEHFVSGRKGTTSGGQN